MRKLIPLAVCGILLTGCTSTRSMMITEDTALITVVRQSAEGRASAVDMAIAEAARITREHGFRYFVILDSADASQTGVRVLPGQPIPIVPRQTARNTIFTSFNPPGSTYTTPSERMAYIKLRLDLTVRMYRQGEINP